MRVSILPRALVTGLSALALAACGTMFKGDGRPQAPNYASPAGTDQWEVNCGRSRIFVDDDSLEQFYREDGSLMTYTEFCQRSEPSHIRRERRRSGAQ